MAQAGAHAPAASGTVTFRVRRLAPHLTWVLAIDVLWVTVASTALGASVWYVALIAACVVGWSRF